MIIDPPGSEEHLEIILVDYLRTRGEFAEQQVRCSAGIADIVSDVAVYEVKLRLTRSDFQRAVGQVLLYRAAGWPDRRAVVAGLRGQDELPIEDARYGGHP